MTGSIEIEKSDDSQDTKTFMTRPEAARHLRVGIATLDRLEAKGRLRAVRMPSPAGGRDIVRYTVAQLDGFIQRNGGRLI
jgi:hypothetical protein